MATAELHNSRASGGHDSHHTTDDDEDYSVADDAEEETDGEEETNGADDGDDKAVGWCWRRKGVGRSCGYWGKVLDPRAKWVQEWNRVFLLVCAMGLFVDPLFFYALSVSDSCMCLFVDGWFAVTVSVLRCMTDALHLWNMWLQFKMGKRHFGSGLTVDTNRRWVALRYLKLKTGFFFDLFVILPLPQIVLWVAIPYLLEKGSVTLVMTVFLIMFLFQYLPKIYHSVCVLRRLQNLSGYIFGTVWWGIALNLIAYFVASHAAGACWYLLGIQRAAKCLKEQCGRTSGCGLRLLSYTLPYLLGPHDSQHFREPREHHRMARSGLQHHCFDQRPHSCHHVDWKHQGVSACNDIKEASDAAEDEEHRMVDEEEAPTFRFRQRVRNYERQRWAAMRGVDEFEMIRNLPEGLRRDIKYHLCLDLVRQVPLFQHMDELVLENICDRVKSLIFTKGETITREGDPVQRMLFVVRGHLQSSQVLRDGVKSYCMLGPGNFSGDELLSWCLRRLFIERLPPSSSTLITLETTEAFGLEAEDVKYVTQHFRYTFMNEKVKRSARYYSPGWRTWAAVAIQLAWRRHKHRLTLSSLSFIRPRRPVSRSSSLGEDRLRLYTALLTSPKPNQDDFDY
ncbi:hypothetical protein K1719_046451 [Acacia pycnantha]|nr:hypothetical protein K1719_046451 [Acacia pycnantha]